jgi:hypothetical protein
MYLKARNKKRYNENNDDMIFFCLLMSMSFLLNKLYRTPPYYLPNRTIWLDSQQLTFWEKNSEK